MVNDLPVSIVKITFFISLFITIRLETDVGNISTIKAFSNWIYFYWIVCL